MGNRDATRDAAGDRDAGEIDDRGDAVRLASWREERRDRRDERRRDARRRAGTSSPYTQTPHPSIALGAVGFDDRQRANELTLKLRVAPVKNQNTTVRGRRYLVFLGFSRGIWTSFPRGMRGLHEIASFGRFEATSPRVGTGQTVCARDRPRVRRGTRRNALQQRPCRSGRKRVGRTDPILAARTREGKVTVDDLTGGTFTITNAGNIGGLFATPVINFPEVAICGVHAIKDTPVIRDGECVPGKKMYLSVSIDHRLVDGATGAHWMNVVKDHLEQPYRMLLG